MNQYAPMNADDSEATEVESQTYEPRFAERLESSNARRRAAQQGCGPTAYEMGYMSADLHDAHACLIDAVREAQAAGLMRPEYLPAFASLLKAAHTAGRLLLDVERFILQLSTERPSKPR